MTDEVVLQLMSDKLLAFRNFGDKRKFAGHFYL